MDKIKLLLVFVTIVIVGAGIYKGKILNDQRRAQPEHISAKREVEGASTMQNPEVVAPQTTALQQTVQEKITTLTKEAQNLSLPEIASSSPQVQKILQDLKNLEQYPKSQVKDACQKICDSL